MENATPQVTSESQQQARLDRKRLAIAYEKVFGQEGSRTEEQKLVFDDLSLGIGQDDETYRFQDRRDGIAIIASGLRRDGAQSIVRLIRTRLKHAQEEPKPKGKRIVKR